MGVAGTNAQLVAYANGAVAPFDPNNAKATAEHQKGIAEAGGVNFPFGVHATGVVVPHVYAAHPLVYGKRDADAQLVHHPNGAITPHDPNLAAATAAHLATKGYGVYGYPYHYGVYGKREADAQLVHHANGVITPTLPLPPTHTLPPGLDTTDTLTYTERGRLISPSALCPDTLPSMPDTPSTPDMAWLP